VEVTLLLCDWAESINGKLYILGGGWSRMAANLPIPVALAIKLGIPWDQANRQIPFKAELVTEDGQSVVINETPVMLEGEIEVGRPPGTRPGSTLDAVLSIRFPALALQKGAYTWIFQADNKEAGRVSFEAIDVPKGGSL